MLLAVLIATLVTYSWGLFSKYMSSEDELDKIEDVAKFNEQFANYERNDVKGYEIMSLINKVIDYNARQSNVGTNDKNFSPITITINMGDENQRKKLTPDGEKNRLFGRTSYVQSNTSHTIENDINRKLAQVEDFFGKDGASKLAKAYFTLYPKPVAQMSEEEKRKAIEKFNGCTQGTKLSENSEINSIYSKLLGERQNLIATYYEYLKFKSGIFKFNGSVGYDQITGRVSSMAFEYVGEI